MSKNEAVVGSIEVLQAKHEELDSKLQRLERRAYLTPEEQRQTVELKKRKLATKDRIVAIQRS